MRKANARSFGSAKIRRPGFALCEAAGPQAHAGDALDHAGHGEKDRGPDPDRRETFQALAAVQDEDDGARDEKRCGKNSTNDAIDMAR